MNIRQKPLENEVWLVEISGRLDQNLSPQLEKQLMQLIEAEQHKLIVDLSQVNYINSGGLRCLVTAWRQAKQQGGNLLLSGLNRRLQEVFGMVGFDKVFQIHDTIPEAEKAWQIAA